MKTKKNIQYKLSKVKLNLLLTSHAVSFWRHTNKEIFFPELLRRENMKVATN